MTAEEFTERVSDVILTARDEGLSVEDIIVELNSLLDTLKGDDEF
jgi:hypothetical protein